MPIRESIQKAHDELIESMPKGTSHNESDCPVCTSGLTEKAEEASMPDEKMFTEAQHVALLASAVERETASLTTGNQELAAKVEELETEKASHTEAVTNLNSKIDTLESEKAGETARADAAEKAFDDYKAELTEMAAVETRKSERLEAVKAADEKLTDDYFTDERVQRWAEMADDSFAALVEDLREAAAKKPAFLTKDDDADDADGKSGKKIAEKARETSAFTGGEAPTEKKTSAFRALMTATGHMPAAN